MTSTLEQWIAEEAQLRASMGKGVGEGVASREQVLDKTGLEIMQGILRGELPTPPIASQRCLMRRILWSLG
jgi:hypothetical protein